MSAAAAVALQPRPDVAGLSGVDGDHGGRVEVAGS